MKKAGRKLLGIMLAASMSVAAIFPMQGMAAEGRDTEPEYVEEETVPGEGKAEELGEGEKEPEKNMTEEPGEGEEEKELEDGKILEGENQEQKLEEKNLEEEGAKNLQLSEAGTEDESMQTGEETEASDEAEGQTFMLPQSNGEEKIMPLEDSYDINQPVIEGFELVENGQTLTKEDELHFNISVYDADSDVSSISVVLSGRNYYDNVLKFQKSTEGNLYTATLPCSQIQEGSYFVYSIRVEDAKSNYVDGKVQDENGQYLYQFTLEGAQDSRNVTLSNFRMTKEAADGTETLKAGDKVTYTADVQCENEEIRDCYMNVSTYQSSYSYSQSIRGVYHAESNSITGTFKVEDNTYPTEWKLRSVQIYTESGGYYYFSIDEIEQEEELTFRVEQEYDDKKPVIKRITVDQNGETVHEGDTVTMRVEVEEEHPSASASAKFTTEAPNGTRSESVSLKYDADSKEYIGTVQIKDTTYPGQWALSYLYITDTFWNRAYLSDYKGDGEEELLRYYIVSPDAYDGKKPVIQSIRIEEQLAKAGDIVTVTVEVEEENPYDIAEARFDAQDLDYAGSTSVSLRYDKSLKAYVGRIEITETTAPCKWEFAYLHICDKNGNSTELSDYEEDGPWYYTVDPDGYDMENPVIENITIEKNGEFVKAGDVVNIRVKVNEKYPSRSGTAYFYPQVTNVSAYSQVELWYDSSSREYTGTISITDDTYPCEWMLTNLEITDRLGRKAYLSDYQPDWSGTYPWYYKVKSGNTYREDVKDVTFHFYGYAKQADGSYQPDSLISSQTVKNVGRRVTLKELGILPQPMEGVHTTWTYSSWFSREVDENTELLFAGTENTECSLFASYDKGCANVSLTYMADGSGEKTVMVPCFIDRESTYQDVLEVLELPEDGKNDDFVRFKLSYSDDYHNETIQVGDVARISVEAEYKNCQVAWNTRYVNKDGTEISKVITKSYLDGTKVSDALAELEAPEDTDGMEIEGWVLLNATEDEMISQPMTSLDVVAVYRGKTTVDTSYTYRGEDGIMACGSKMLVMDGENLSDAAIQGEATGVFKDVEHLKGLMLYEWAGDVNINQGKYKKIQFQALYYNCVAVLKYPDETCEYVVVDKNAAFTLPTENEAYEDIVWEGYEKGQKVVIAEDQEFLAESAKRKDGTKEEPEGVRLSEEEIARIKEELEKAEDGASIKIDMKKATVVPKEVLEAIKEKPVDIVLDMGAYSWSISGLDVAATDLKDIDLEVTIGTDTVPSSLVDSIAEGKPATQISLTHNGEFGFRADLTLNLGSENSGSTANLYYYDSSGKLIFRNAGQIGADGSTSLSFSHASDYVVVIDKNTADTEQKDKETGGQENSGKEENSGGQENSEEENSGGQNENTGKQDKKEEDTGKGDSNKKKADRDQGDGSIEEAGKENQEEDETANLKNNPDHTTMDSGSTEASNADSGKMKSPKTGE